MPGRPMLDYEGAAAYLGLTVSGVKKLVVQRRVAFMKTAPNRQGHVRFDPDELDRFIRQNTTPARSAS